MGTITWLASELMFFATLFSAYYTIRSVVPELWAQETQHLEPQIAAIPTVILILSSVTCQLGVFAATRGKPGRSGGLFQFSAWGMREWFILSFIMGAIFMGGQAYEYATLVHEGLTLQSSVYGSLFYIATGIHGLHVLGGLIAFLLVIGRTYAARKFTHEQAVSAIVVSYYWHFVDVIWILLFASIYLIQ